MAPPDAASLARWRDRWSGRSLSSIEREEIRAYVADLSQRGTSSRALERERWLLQSYFRWALSCGWIQSNPAAELDRPRPSARERAVVWTPSEQKRLLEACRGRPATSRYLLPLVLTSLKTGLRLGHAANLEWRHIDLLRARVTIPAGETFCGREIQTSLDLDLQRCFGALLPLAGKSPLGRTRVFGAAGLPEWKDRADLHAVKAAFRLARHRAGIPHGGFDSLRLTFVHNCAMACVPIDYPFRVGDWDDPALVKRIYAQHEARRSSR